MPPNSDQLFLIRLELNAPYRESAHWTPETHARVEDHARWLHRLGRAGRLVLAGRTTYEPDDERLFGLVLVKAPDQATAEQWMREDPALRAGIMSGQTFDFSTACWYPENHSGTHG